MARKLRVEHPGAIYHVMNRGDRRECDRPKRGQNGLAQPALLRFAHQISNESGERGSDNDIKGELGDVSPVKRTQEFTIKIL